MTGLLQRIADFEKPFGIVGVAGSDDDEAGKIAIDRLDAMGMLARNLRRSAIGPPKNDRHIEPAARHVMGFAGIRNQLVGCDKRKIPAHELDDRPKPVCAAPIASPANPFSAIGVSMTPLRTPFVRASLLSLCRRHCTQPPLRP